MLEKAKDRESESFEEIRLTLIPTAFNSQMTQK